MVTHLSNNPTYGNALMCATSIMTGPDASRGQCFIAPHSKPHFGRYTDDVLESRKTLGGWTVAEWRWTSVEL